MLPEGISATARVAGTLLWIFTRRSAHPYSLRRLQVAFDKSEGVVKRHFFSAMLSSTAWISERWRTEALKLSR
jgi:hypothetical protein